MQNTKTVQILCRLQEHDRCRDHNNSSHFFGHPIVIRSLAKHIGAKDIASTKRWVHLRYNLRQATEIIPGPFLGKHSQEVHERLLFFILEREKEAYDKLLLADGAAIDKMTHAVLAIFYERWEYLPVLKDELLVKDNVKLLLRLLCGTSNFHGEKDKILGAQTILDDFTYRRTVCFAAGAYGKRDLCYFFAKEYPDYVGYMIKGATQFGWSKLAQRLEPLAVFEDVPSAQTKVVVVSNDQLFYASLFSFACSFICLLLITFGRFR